MADQAVVVLSEGSEVAKEAEIVLLEESPLATVSEDSDLDGSSSDLEADKNLAHDQDRLGRSDDAEEAAPLISRQKAGLRDAFDPDENPLYGEDPGPSIDPKCRLSYGSSVDTLGSRASLGPKKGAVGVVLKWTDLKVSVTQGKGEVKTILNGVDGVAHPGQLLAIMGSSGAGKSTLLNALAGHLGANYKVEGTIRSKHLGDGEGSRSRKTSFGFVHQSEVFFHTMTVREHLTFAAAMRLKDMPEAERAGRVEDQIAKLGLEKCRDTTIMSTLKSKGISGGEKKRLAFAGSTIHHPHLFLADEPTTGLDSSSAREAVAAMKNMAGTTVVCTIHQPSSEIFYMFDKLLLLAEGGRVAYFGTPKKCIKFFDSLSVECPSNFNPADIYIKAIAVDPQNPEKSKAVVKTICQKFEKKRAAKVAAASGRDDDSYSVDYKLELGSKGNFPREVGWIARRAFRDSARNKAAHLNRIFQRMFVVAVLAVMYANVDIQHPNQKTIIDVNGVFFIFLNDCVFPMLYGFLYAFPRDLPVVSCEVADGLYSSAAFYVGKVLASMPILFLDVAVNTAIFYFVVGLGPFGYYCFTTFVGFSCACVSAAFGILLSMCFMNVASAAAVGGVFNVLIYSFSGFYLNFDTLPFYMYWIRYLNWFSYGFVLIMTWHWSAVEHIACELQDQSSCKNTGEDVLEYYSIPRSDNISPYDVLGLVGLFFLYHALAFLLYLRRLKKYSN